MMKLNAEKLWIVASFQSTEQTRYYLCGVYVEPCATGGIVMTATDGHRLVTARDADGYCDKAEIVSVSKDTMRNLKKADHALINDDGQIELISGEIPIHIQPGDSRIDGTFPEYSQVIPRECSGEQGLYNVKYLGDFKAMFGFAKNSAVLQIKMNGESAALIYSGDPDVIGVLMPMRGYTLERVPEWCGNPSATECAA